MTLFSSLWPGEWQRKVVVKVGFYLLSVASHESNMLDVSAAIVGLKHLNSFLSAVFNVFF